MAILPTPSSFEGVWNPGAGLPDPAKVRFSNNFNLRNARAEKSRSFIETVRSAALSACRHRGSTELSSRRFSPGRGANVSNAAKYNLASTGNHTYSDIEIL